MSFSFRICQISTLRLEVKFWTFWSEEFLIILVIQPNTLIYFRFLIWRATIRLFLKSFMTMQGKDNFKLLILLRLKLVKCMVSIEKYWLIFLLNRNSPKKDKSWHLSLKASSLTRFRTKCWKVKQKPTRTT